MVLVYRMFCSLSSVSWGKNAASWGKLPPKTPKSPPAAGGGLWFHGCGHGPEGHGRFLLFQPPPAGARGALEAVYHRTRPSASPVSGGKMGHRAGVLPGLAGGVFGGFVGVWGDFIENRPNRGPKGSLFRRGRGVRHCAQREARPGAGRGVRGWFQGWGAAYSSSTSRLTRSIWRRRSTLWVRKPVSRPRETAWSMRVFSPSGVRAGRSSYRSCPT